MRIWRERDLRTLPIDHAEKWGYGRYWLAEHHNIPGIASAATALVIGHVASGTQTIRVGAGGIMLPNHAPLVVAEQFGTLATLFPNRIDLGLGRAPGSDPATSRALRRNLQSSPERFGEDVAELQSYFRAARPGQAVREMVERALACSIVGSPQTVRREIEAFVLGTRADELLLTAQIHDHAARLRSFEIAAQVRQQMAEDEVATKHALSPAA